MQVAFFFYGTLRDPEVRQIVLGPAAATFETKDARLPGYRCGPIESGRYPGIVEEEGSEAPGLYLPRVSLDAAARTSYFEGDGFHYDIGLQDILLETGTAKAWVYIPTAALPVGQGHWDIETWHRSWRGSFLADSEHTMKAAGAEQISRHRLAWTDRLSRLPGS